MANEPDKPTRPQGESVVVLLVDDQAIIGHAVRQMLAPEPDIQFHFCQDPLKALEMANAIKPTVILQDLVMPDIDGLTLLKYFRANPATREVPMIVLSSKEEPTTKAQAFALGASDYLVKLPDRIELVARIRHHSRGYRAQLERDDAFARLAELNRDLERKVAERSAELVHGRDTLIFGLAKLAESRDDETGKHLERICAYVELLGRELLARGAAEVTEMWVSTVAKTAALHDIGKVGTPDAVLRKPGSLTPDERKIIQKHPCVGGDALLAIKGRWGENPFLNAATEIALCHHEKWDGSGYPYGLRGADIPLSARVVALADVYDALTSPRVYKPAMSHQEAVAIISTGSGSHFDPQVVAAFEATAERFAAVAAENR
jgi:putative two-component system response regulator